MKSSHVIATEPHPGLAPAILKMESWTHMGRTTNIVINDVIHIFCVHQQKHAYFADGTALSRAFLTNENLI